MERKTYTGRCIWETSVDRGIPYLLFIILLGSRQVAVLWGFKLLRASACQWALVSPVYIGVFQIVSLV